MMLAAATLLAAGCATSGPPPAPPPGFAIAPRPDSPFAPAELEIRAAHGAQASGFMLLGRNEDALGWRLATIDAARHSLDLQYYVWFGDRAGQLMMARTLAAADRGVKVRILFDDLNSMLHDMTHVELRDDTLAVLDAHPNIELRLFNAWRGRSLLERITESAGDFNRLNRRMHNKQMIIDNRVAIVGGRNIGDEYFGLNPEFNFHDLDVLALGPVARDASAAFDRYWNSGWAFALPARPAGARPPDPSQAALRAIRDLEADPRLRRALAGRGLRDAALQTLGTRLHVGTGRVLTDPPARDAATRNRMPQAFRALMRSAQREVLIVNAYIIPDATFMADLAELAGHGVAVRILTNSLASHDVPAVNSHYEGYRAPIVRTGAALHELRPDAAIRATEVDTPPVRSGFVGLHTKAMVVDRERAFVGSMNLDPRSEIFNSEMGAFIDSAPLALELAGLMERDMAGANAWRVSLAADGSLRWQDDTTVLDRQPARNMWQRVANVFFKLFPPNLY